MEYMHLALELAKKGCGWTAPNPMVGAAYLKAKMEIFGAEQVNLIFDYDGTLHNFIKIYVPAFRLAYAYLVSKGYVLKKNWTAEEISCWRGSRGCFPGL